MIFRTKKKLHKQLAKRSLVDKSHFIFLLCCFSLLVPYIVLGGMNPGKSCNENSYYKPYVTVYKKIRGKVVKTMDPDGFMDTSKLCDKFICLNGPVMIYEDALDTGDGKIPDFEHLDSGLHTDGITKREARNACVPGKNGIPPGFDCKATGSGSGAHSNSSSPRIVTATGSPTPVEPQVDPSPTLMPESSTTMPDSSTTMPDSSTIMPDSSTTMTDSTTTESDDSSPAEISSTSENSLDTVSTTPDDSIFTSSTTDSSAPPSPTTAPSIAPNLSLFKKARLEVYDHKCFKLNQLPKKTKMNNRVITSRIITNDNHGNKGGAGGRSTGGLGSCNMDNVIGRKIFGIKMLGNKDDYRVSSLTQFESQHFEHLKAGSTRLKPPYEHSFAVVGNADHFDFCYDKKSQTENVFLRLRMKNVPNPPKVCLYEPGENAPFDNYFHGKPASAFSWKDCPSKLTDGMKTGNNTTIINYDHFATFGRSSIGRMHNSGYKGISRMKTTTTMSPSGIARGRKKGVSQMSEAVVSSNCTNLPTFDAVRCGGKDKTEDTCKFLEVALELGKEDDDPQIKIRRDALNLIDGIFEKICVKVSSHLPPIVSRLLLFYMDQVIKGGGSFPIMKNETWKFLKNDLQTCFMNAEPMRFKFDEDGGEDDYDDSGVLRSRLNKDDDSDEAFGNLGVDFNDGLNRIMRHNFDDDAFETGVLPGLVPGASFQKSFQELDDENLSHGKRANPSSGSSGGVATGRALSGSGGTIGRARSISPQEQGEEYLMRSVQELEEDEDEDDDGNVATMPINVEVIHVLPTAKTQRQRRQVTTESGIKLFYYSEAAEIEYDFNVALDAHWKVFSTVLGYCNKFYKSRKAETFPRLYNTYFEDMFEPIEDTWISSSDNDALEVVVSAFADPVTTEWLNSCLEASYIVSDSITFRPPRPLIFPEGADTVTNYFEEVPPPDFFTPERLKKAIMHGYANEPNAVDSNSGQLTKGRMVPIPNDPGCHWACSNGEDDCHKVCGPSEKAAESPKSITTMHGPDGEKTIIESEVQHTQGLDSDEEYFTDPAAKAGNIPTDDDLNPRLSRKSGHGKKKRGRHSKFGRKYSSSELNAMNHKISTPEKYYDSMESTEKTIPYNFTPTWNSTDPKWHTGTVRKYDPSKIKDVLDPIIVNEEEKKENPNLEDIHSRKKHMKQKENTTSPTEEDSKLESSNSPKGHSKIKNNNHSRLKELNEKNPIHRNDTKLEEKIPSHKTNKLKEKYNKNSKMEESTHSYKKHSKMEEHKHSHKKDAIQKETDHSNKKHSKMEEKAHSYKEHSKIEENKQHSHKKDSKLEENSRTHIKNSNLENNGHFHRKASKMEERRHFHKKALKMEENNHFHKKASKMEVKHHFHKKTLKMEENNHFLRKASKIEEIIHSNENASKIEEKLYPHKNYSKIKEKLYPHKNDTKKEEKVYFSQQDPKLEENILFHKRDNKDSKIIEDNTRWHHRNQEIDDKNDKLELYKKFFKTHEHSSKSKANAHDVSVHKARKKDERKKAKVKSKHSVLAKRLPIFDVSGLDPLPTTQVPTKLVGATTTFYTTTPVPFMTTTFHKSQRKIDNGNGISQSGRNTARKKHNRAKKARRLAYARRLK